MLEMQNNRERKALQSDSSGKVISHEMKGYMAEQEIVEPQSFPATPKIEWDVQVAQPDWVRFCSFNASSEEKAIELLSEA